MQGHPRTPVEAALRRRGDVGRIVEVFRRRGVERIRDVEVERLPPAAGCPRHAAEDGGSSLVDFESFTLFIVRGWSALYEPMEESGVCRYAQWSSDSWADVGIVVPHHYAEERVRLYREVVELWLARRSLAFSGGASLWDGSIAPLVAGHRPGSSDMSMSEALTEALRNAGGGVLRRIASEHERAPLAARMILQEVYDLNELIDAIGGDAAPWIAFLEWFEKLIALKRYLEEAWARRVLPIFVSKTSRSSILLRGSLPDVYYLRIKEPVEPFVTKPVLVGFEGLRFTFGRPGGEAGPGEVRGPFFPEEEGLEDFFRRKLSVVVFYARLARGGPILRVDVAVPSDSLEGSPDEPVLIRDVALTHLLSIPHPDGYPLPLQVAHANARISEQEKRAVLEVLGLSFERLGRGVLTL